MAGEAARRGRDRTGGKDENDVTLLQPVDRRPTNGDVAARRLGAGAEIDRQDALGRFRRLAEQSCATMR